MITLKNLNTFVQGFIVGPTPNPLSCFSLSKTLFNKNDFPVLYFPTNDIIPMLLYCGWLKISFASSVIMNSITKIFIFLIYLLKNK